MATKEALVSQREVDPVLRPEDVLLVGGGIDVTTPATPLEIGASASAITFGVPPTLPASTVGMVQFATITIGHADLTAAALSQVIDLAPQLPAGAMVVGRPSIALATPFTDGVAAAVSLDIGSAGDPNAIVAGADLDAAAVDGQVSTMPEGVAPGRLYTVATTLIATVTADVNVDTLNAGEVTIHVPYVLTA